jgi:hypothetical protein
MWGQRKKQLWVTTNRRNGLCWDNAALCGSPLQHAKRPGIDRVIQSRWQLSAYLWLSFTHNDQREWSNSALLEHIVDQEPTYINAVLPTRWPKARGVKTKGTPASLREGVGPRWKNRGKPGQKRPGSHTQGNLCAPGGYWTCTLLYPSQIPYQLHYCGQRLRAGNFHCILYLNVSLAF